MQIAKNETKPFIGQLGVDINGNKKPNQIWKDMFWFSIDSSGILTAGRGRTSAEGSQYHLCDIDSNESVYNGYGCSEWIIVHENMDYLRHSIAPKASEETE